MTFNAMTEHYEEITVCGKPALFTIILTEPLELPDGGRRYIDEETDWDYSPLEGKGTADHEPCTTISTFMAVYGHQKLS